MLKVVHGLFSVAPRMGAWIEIFIMTDEEAAESRSRPAWARGLKSQLEVIALEAPVSRAPYGRVD